jgi:hypothetical protein
MDEINKSPGRKFLDRGWQLRKVIVAGKIERCVSAPFQSTQALEAAASLLERGESSRQGRPQSK